MAHTRLSLTLILSALSVSHAQARDDHRSGQLTGTWYSQADTTNAVTTLYHQGRFKTAFLVGEHEIGRVSGSWRLDGNCFAWTYDGSGREDRDPILSLSDDAFTLREANGDVSVFTRQSPPVPHAATRRR